jgi:MerR family transcriptional regulator, light-induced transcriptional regulator
MAILGGFFNGAGQGSALSADRHSGPDLDDSCRLPAAAAVPHFQSLVRAVEGEIVPRLLLARRQAAAVPVPANLPEIEAGDAQELARLLLVHEVDIPFAYVESVRYRGAEVRDIYTFLLAPAARYLGEMWERDECDFLQVTLGLGRLHQLLQRVSLLEPGPERLDSRGHGRRALLVTAPGEVHSFGVMMVSQFFRRDGWEVWNEFPETERDLAACVKKHSFAVVGLSAGSETRFEALASAVRVVRRHSLNPAVGVMVGGPLFAINPDLALRVGADATAQDGESAARRAEAVCALLANEK